MKEELMFAHTCNAVAAVVICKLPNSNIASEGGSTGCNMASPSYKRAKKQIFK